MSLETRKARMWTVAIIAVVLFTLLGGLVGGAPVALVTFLVLAGFIAVGFGSVALLNWVGRGKR